MSDMGSLVVCVVLGYIDAPLPLFGFSLVLVRGPVQNKIKLPAASHNIKDSVVRSADANRA